MSFEIKISLKNCNIVYFITESPISNHCGLAAPYRYFHKLSVGVLINNKAVYRTAPTTPGLLITTWLDLVSHTFWNLWTECVFSWLNVECWWLCYVGECEISSTQLCSTLLYYTELLPQTLHRAPLLSPPSCCVLTSSSPGQWNRQMVDKWSKWLCRTRAYMECSVYSKMQMLRR